MRFLANKNFPVMSVRYLRSAGYNVAYGSEDAPLLDKPSIKSFLRLNSLDTRRT